MEQFSKFKSLYSVSQVVNNLLQFNKYSTADKLKIERMATSLKSMAFKAEKKRGIIMTKKIDISPSNIECINISIAFCNNLITKMPQVGEQADAAITALENLGDAIITEESK